MAEHFKEASKCMVCLNYLENPMYLKCGYVCCFRCLDSLRKEVDGGGLLCPNCSVVSQKNDLRRALKLGALVSKVKELEPQLRAVLQMNPRMRKFQVDVTLDVDTANKYLVVSEDLKTVRCGFFKQKKRSRPERFSRTTCVLGFPLFTSGRHYWEVDLGSSQEWDLGVCKESVRRRGKTQLAPDLGFWTVSLRNGDVFSAHTVPSAVLKVGPRLHRVGIFLDMNIGIVSFYHIGDGSHIFTFTKVSAGEPLRPFFSPAYPTEDDQSFLRICPLISLGTDGPLWNPGQSK
ncbi:ret finger protein-like 4A [Sagmatias obliquidens]|uniref:ret finger protein-like 4A n=1 Tax=Sagmatias obliquidens TaxID=3371155 RepID=UPI000F444D6D|nr:ret finger protein-like 4A [Lagenorhynchus obliquidens]